MSVSLSNISRMKRIYKNNGDYLDDLRFLYFTKSAETSALEKKIEIYKSSHSRNDSAIEDGILLEMKKAENEHYRDVIEIEEYYRLRKQFMLIFLFLIIIIVVLCVFSANDTI